MRNEILNSNEISVIVFSKALQEIIFIIESDILPRFTLASLSQNTADNLDEGQKKKNAFKRRFSLKGISKIKLKPIKEKLTITLVNILDVHNCEIIDRDEKLEDFMIKLLESCKLTLPHYEVFCDGKIVDKSSAVSNFIGKHLVVEYKIVFHFVLPNGKKIGSKVDGFKTIKSVFPAILIRFGYRFKSFNFYVESSGMKINPSDFIQILNQEVVKMELRHSIFSSMSTDRFFPKYTSKN